MKKEGTRRSQIPSLGSGAWIRMSRREEGNQGPPGYEL
jgi:hypothetical protein